MNIHLKVLHRRLARARKHIQNFERQANRFIKNGPYQVVTEIDSDGVNQFLRYKLQGGKDLPPNMSFTVGDCIHNLRSTLDNTVWQLASMYGCSNSILNHITFPVCEDSARFTVKLKTLKGLPQPAIDIIESLQPYKFFKGRNEPDSHPLWILNRL